MAQAYAVTTVFDMDDVPGYATPTATTNGGDKFPVRCLRMLLWILRVVGLAHIGGPFPNRKQKMQYVLLVFSLLMLISRWLVWIMDSTFMISNNFLRIKTNSTTKVTTDSRALILLFYGHFAQAFLVALATIFFYLSSKRHLQSKTGHHSTQSSFEQEPPIFSKRMKLFVTVCILVPLALVPYGLYLHSLSRIPAVTQCLKSPLAVLIMNHTRNHVGHILCKYNYIAIITAAFDNCILILGPLFLFSGTYVITRYFYHFNNKLKHIGPLHCSSIIKYKCEYSRLCNYVNDFNETFGVLIVVYLLLSILGICVAGWLLINGALRSSLVNSSPYATIAMFIGILLLLMVGSSILHDQARVPLGTLHGLVRKCEVNLRTLAFIHYFMDDIRYAPSVSAMGFISLTKHSSLMVIGAIFAYFFILVQMQDETTKMDFQGTVAKG